MADRLEVARVATGPLSANSSPLISRQTSSSGTYCPGLVPVFETPPAGHASRESEFASLESEISNPQSQISDCLTHSAGGLTSRKSPLQFHICSFAFTISAPTDAREVLSEEQHLHYFRRLNAQQRQSGLQTASHQVAQQQSAGANVVRFRRLHRARVVKRTEPVRRVE